MRPLRCLASLKLRLSLNQSPPSRALSLNRLTRAPSAAIENGKPVADEAAAETKSHTAAAAVKITEKSKVLPRKPPEKQRVPLATFDLPFITFYYIQKLLVYNGGVEEHDVVVGRMKEALAAALDEYYPLAGKLVQDEDGAMSVDCGGKGEDVLQGAEVVDGEAEGVRVVDLAEGDSPEELIKEVLPYTGVMNLEGLSRPLLAVQITKLKDGIALGCAFNHAIIDGSSTWHFMKSWAGLACGKPVSTRPLHDRKLARLTRVPISLPSSPAAHELTDPNLAPPASLRARIFSFSESAVLLLKSAANSSLPFNAKPFSTFQSLTAHIWRAVSRARRLLPDAITVFAVFVDCRHRVLPKLPDSYFGNHVQAVFTATAVGPLLNSPPEFSTGLLQKAIDAHNDAAVKGRLEEYEANPKFFRFSDAGVNCVVVGSSPRFRVYDIDFGFGKPERVRGGKNNTFDGMMYLYQARDGGEGIDVELTLSVEAMENLKMDGEFLKYLNKNSSI